MHFMVEPLHQERHPGKPAFDPHQLQLGKALGQRVDDPVGHVDQIVVHERQRVHRDEAIELRERRIVPMRPGVEDQRLARFLDHRVEPHVLIVMHRLVAHGADGEADDLRIVADIRAPCFSHSSGDVERQIGRPMMRGSSGRTFSVSQRQ